MDGGATTALPTAEPDGAASGALLSLRGVRRDFPAGDGRITVLQDVDLDIAAGEMVAIVGPSGSGKSTLMNLLGCLDRPSGGTYRVAGRPTGAMEADALAALRRAHFGFIFQRHHLLPALTALANVELPAVYAGASSAARHERAHALLTRLGLAERLRHTPGQLSGGQQQRVSIARALMNGGTVILADEPTGSLDSVTGDDVMRILQELHAAGHTVVIVTHDMQVAAHAGRVIEIRDGRIAADRSIDHPLQAPRQVLPRQHAPRDGLGPTMGRLADALRMALLAMQAHRLRTFLTMLGIVIGIAAVMVAVAIGEGSRRSVLRQISTLGTNTIDIYPGKGFGEMGMDSTSTLVAGDAETLAQQPYADSTTPLIANTATLRFGNVNATASVNGVGARFFRVYNLQMLQGLPFDEANLRARDQVAVIDDTAAAKLCPGGETALGAVILLGSVPVRVIGVVQHSPMRGGNMLNVYLPYTTMLGRIVNQSSVQSIGVRVSDTVPMAVAQREIERLMGRRHGRKDFFLFSTDAIRRTVNTTRRTLTLQIGAIALISLVVGGIGVMNIMLVAVTERTREIGVRMAVGARQSDIQQQFLIEAVLVCLFGGVIGIALALGIGPGLARLDTSLQPIYSAAPMVAAVGVSALVGLVFGFLPARNAARLDPVVALARE